MFVDIHTHTSDNQSIIRIIDNEFNEIILTSQGIHPWDVEDMAAEAFSIPADGKNDMFAIGEVGLDKAHKSTFDKQIEVFAEMIKLSENLRKPMIIHCVRAYSDIIAMRKQLKATMPWVIHGFNGNVETLLQLLKHDIYISLGEVLYRNEDKAAEIIKNLPIDRLFLETDVSGRDIKDVYTKAAMLMYCSLDYLCDKIYENYGRLETAH